MANSVVKLTIDSQEYDAKLKSAGKALNEYFDICKKGDRTFEVLDEGVVEAVQAMGKMETKSKSAAGQLKELETAFRDMSLIYRRFTEEEKNGEGGKAMAQSLSELKTRINDTKKELSEINKEINGGGGLTGALDSLAGKFGMNIQQLAGWGAAIGAAKVALDVAKDAFFQSESNIDEWGRTVQGAQGAYEVFLNTLNGGNWSNFFSNMSTAVQGARDLYDALDRLGSIKSNNQAAIAIVQQQIQQLRLAKQQGQDVDAQIKEATQKLAALQQQSVDAGKYAGRKMIGETIRNTYNTQDGAKPLTQGSIDRAANELLNEGQKAFDKYKKAYQRLSEKAEDTRVVNTVSSVTGGMQTTTERYTNLNKLTDEERKQYLLSKAITESETQLQEGISTYAQAVVEATSNAKEQFKSNRYALTGSSSDKTTTTVTNAKELTPLQETQKKISDLTNEALTADDERLEVIKKEIAALNEQLKVYKEIQDYVSGKTPNFNVTVGDRKAFEADQMRRFEADAGKQTLAQQMEYSTMKEIRMENVKADTKTLHSIIKDALQQSIDTAGLNLDPISEQIAKGIDVPEDTWKAILDEYNALREQIGLEPITIKFETGELEKVGNATNEVGKSMKFAASMTQTLGNALSAIEDPGAKVAATVAQAIASVALAYAETLAKDKSSKWNIFSFIAAAAAATVSMATTIASIHSATGYAEGGIIKGNSYSGDRIGGLVDGSQLVGLNAGELVLTRAMQSNLAGQLQSNGGGGGYASTPYVTGEKIVLGINNWAKRNGRGELVFSR